LRSIVAALKNIAALDVLFWLLQVVPKSKIQSGDARRTSKLPRWRSGSDGAPQTEA
jgi:hypothetical protein